MTMRRFITDFRAVRATLAGAASVACLGMAATASAHVEFPGVIQETYADTLGCAPQCSLCHVSPTGGGALHGDDAGSTYVGPHRGYGVFVQNLRAVNSAKLGSSLSVDNIPPKLKALETVPCNTGDMSDTGICDSDGDGVADYIEVSRGDDPDHAGPGNGATCPKYGCGASSIGALPRRSSDSGHAAAALAALSVALVLGRRFRRGA
jgi:hypothetical protein